MNPRKTLVLLSIVSLAVASFGWREKRLLSDADAALAHVSEHAAGVEREIGHLRGRLATLADERASLQSVAGKNWSPSVELSGSAKSPEKNAVVTVKNLAGMVQDLRQRETSEGQRQELVWQRAHLGESYQSLIQSLGLRPDQAQRFEDALVRRAEDQLDIAAVMREHGLTLLDPALAELWNKPLQDYQYSQKELLGEEGYRKLQEYDRTISVRDLVRSFIGVTTREGQPLNAVQAEQLVEIFAATTESYIRGGQASALSTDWDAGLKEAQKVVSPEQLRLISTYEPQGGAGGIAWMRFNKKLNDALHEDDDRRAETAQTGQSSLPKK